MSRCTHFSSLSDGKGSKVILLVKEADPEVIRKCACGQWSMGSGSGAYVASTYGILYAKMQRIPRNFAEFSQSLQYKCREIPQKSVHFIKNSVFRRK
jgi:hypothetical protein